MSNEETKTNEAKILNKPKTIGFEAIIPVCCREGWDSCPHVTKRQRPSKRNIGL